MQKKFKLHIFPINYMIPILVSTGCYFINPDLNTNIIRAGKHGDGVELSFLDANELYSFNPNKKVIDSLKDKYVTIHAPAKNIKYGKNHEIYTLLKIVYEQFDCKNITFHNNIIKSSYLTKSLSNCNISIEHLDKVKSGENYIKTLEQIFNDNPDFGFVLDFEHAKDDLNILIKKFGDRITEFHWSRPMDNLNHNSYYSVLKDFKKKINIIKQFNKPVVIEINLRHLDFLKEKNVQPTPYIIKNEVELIKSSLH